MNTALVSESEYDRMAGEVRRVLFEVGYQVDRPAAYPSAVIREMERILVAARTTLCSLK